MTVLTESEWRIAEVAHGARFAPVVTAHRTRRSRGEKHPVYDFLFEYYSFRPAHLERWSPGLGVLLLGAEPRSKEWVAQDRGVILDVSLFPQQRIVSLKEVLALLEATASRAPQFGCHGLHEWAMVYRTEDIRHSVPLRLSHGEIATVVEEDGVRCSHFDAFRFFTEAARPLNVLQPTREKAIDLEQPGCIHATQDLYKWAYKFWPWISSELVGDAFELAYDARELDMRASPYDLRHLGFEPVCIETAAGRAEYRHAQRELSERAAPIRARLIDAYRHLLESPQTESAKSASTAALGRTGRY